MGSSLFGKGPWDTFMLPEPVAVRPRQRYEVGIGDDHVPYIRETESGGLTFPTPGTVTAVAIYTWAGEAWAGEASCFFEPDSA